jgi:hypothetical protein
LPRKQPPRAETRPWILEALGEPSLFERLATELTGAELTSVLLEVLRERARQRTPADLLAQYRRDSFVAPARVDQRTLVELDRTLLEASRDFEPIELSPLTPLGTCSAVAVTDQNRVVSSVRGTEVVADPTNVLALECASRLDADPGAVVRLATSQRVVRAQQVPKQPGFSQHFRIFVLATAGREQRDHALLVGALVEQAKTLLRALDTLESSGYTLGPRRITVLSAPGREALGDRLAGALTDVPVTRSPLEQPYYSGGLRYTLWAKDADGNEANLADGGAFDWVAQLTSNRRHVFVASGLGAQLLPLRFPRPA